MPQNTPNSCSSLLYSTVKSVPATYRFVQFGRFDRTFQSIPSTYSVCSLASRQNISKHPIDIQVCAVWPTDSIFQSTPFTYRCVQFGQQTAYFKASLLHTGVCGLANNQHISKHPFYRQVCVAFGSFSSTGQRAPTTYLGKHVQVSTVYSRGLVSTCPP